MLKNINLSTTTSVASNFAGDYAQELIGDALLAGKTLAGNYITPLLNIKYKRALPRVTATNILQVDSPAWTPTSTVTFDERSIDPVALKVNLELPRTTLESHWMALVMKPGALESEIPPSFADYILSYFGKQVGASVEKAIWSGDKTGSTGDAALDNVDGIVTRALKAGSNTVNVAPTTLSASNILAELLKVYNTIPATIFDAEDIKIFVSPIAERYYRAALAAGMGNGGNYYLGLSKGTALDFLGIEVVSTLGMPTNNMIAAQVSNLFFGTDLLTDISNIELLDFSKTTGADTVGYKMRCKMDVNYSWEKQIVAYGTQLS
jgi:hypothetical protein